jgi:hypothetical protein
MIPSYQEVLKQVDCGDYFVMMTGFPIGKEILFEVYLKRYYILKRNSLSERWLILKERLFTANEWKNG